MQTILIKFITLCVTAGAQILVNPIEIKNFTLHSTSSYESKYESTTYLWKELDLYEKHEQICENFFGIRVYYTQTGESEILYDADFKKKIEGILKNKNSTNNAINELKKVISKLENKKRTIGISEVCEKNNVLYITLFEPDVSSLILATWDAVNQKFNVIERQTISDNYTFMPTAIGNKHLVAFIENNMTWYSQKFYSLDPTTGEYELIEYCKTEDNWGSGKVQESIRTCNPEYKPFPA